LGRPDFEHARRIALELLERALPQHLSYHSVRHTRDDVVPAVERLAAIEKIAGQPLILLLTAAYFHDVGFTVRRVEHEAAGAVIARETLPACGYSQGQIDKISGMIMATRLPQQPRTHAERLLADADLDVLGREDFWERNQALREELALADGPVTDEVWLRGQLHFLEGHRYWTRAAAMLRDVRKANHVAELRARLETLTGVADGP
jgi:uncharacterized protein